MKRYSNLNEPELRRLQNAGKIRGFNTQKKPEGSKKNLPTLPAKRSEEKGWLEWNIMYWCNENSLSFEKEFMFHAERKWRFDFAITAVKIAIEYEGIFSAKSGHTTIKGFTKDVQKYNAAQAEGWTIIRCTAKDYKTVPQQLTKILQLKKSA